MQKFISKEKLSKKAKRELNLAQRQTWSINPVSRKQKNKKAYDRKKARSWSYDDKLRAFRYVRLELL
ncbi:MAG: hypothetical protein ACLVML_05295 [Candidatus Gastranaerophilaceae bacterium]|jgi:hypothetical protein|nr:hypothetical protein [Christensenellales bacterium]